ncbi:MAG: hypothetical protein ACE5LB_07760, partial [Acidiferrobacterales bacterium]
VLGHRPSGRYLTLLAFLSIASIALSNLPALRAYLHVGPINHWREARKWVAAFAVVLAGISVFAGVFVSYASASVRLQPYEELVRGVYPSQLPACKWSTLLMLCLPVSYAVESSASGPIVRPSSPDDPVIFISTNGWDAFASSLGFTSGYALQSALWDTAYIPLIYAVLKELLYVEGMSIYQLRSDTLKSLVQVQQQEGRWQVNATIYLPDGVSFELISTHRNKRKALSPIVVALSAY